ncbi:TerD family protein [uncultured Cardiobacterium sp.]|uniref:TerD family protein n=1 Tax=uncultured Cardiobacterium sp. TaxID=417619 RepID=UPI003427978F
MTDTQPGVDISQTLIPGGNAALNSHNIVIRVRSGADIDVAAYRLAGNGKVRGDSDMIFYGQTQCDDDSVSYSGHERESTLAVNLAAQPAVIERIAIAFSAALPLAQLGSLTLSVKADGQTQLQCPVDGSGRRETAPILGECYRRNGVWKFRFVGQGFNGGLKPLSEHYGVEIADDAAVAPAFSEDGTAEVAGDEGEVGFHAGMIA